MFRDYTSVNGLVYVVDGSYHDRIGTVQRRSRTCGRGRASVVRSECCRRHESWDAGGGGASILVQWEFCLILLDLALLSSVFVLFPSSSNTIPDTAAEFTRTAGIVVVHSHRDEACAALSAGARPGRGLRFARRRKTFSAACPGAERPERPRTPCGGAGGRLDAGGCCGGKEED